MVDGASMAPQHSVMAPPSFVHRLRVEAHAVWLAVRDRRTPWHARAFGLLLAAYALSPIDLVPDFIPVLGLLDDAIILPAGVWLFEKMIPAEQLAEHRAEAERATQRPVSRGGVVIVLAVWAVLGWLTWSLAMQLYD